MATTPNMNLDLPDVGTTAGPEYASKNNDAFGAVDSHDHTSSKGVQIPTAGLNINDDLSFNSNNLNSVRGVRLTNESSEPTGAADVRIVYAKNDELFYRDSAGQEVQITTNGSVAGATGTITGLVSPAAATYNSIGSIFTVTKDSNKPAKFDVSDITIREFDVASANGVTIASPAGLGAAYALTLPVAQSADATFELVGIDSTGQLKYGAVTETTNQTTISKTTSGYQVGTVQDIHTGAGPTFESMTLTGVSGSFGLTLGDSGINREVQIFSASSSERLVIEAGGVQSAQFAADEVRTLQPIRGEDGSAATPSYSFDSDLDTGMYSSGVGQISFATAGTRKMIVGSSYNRSYQPFTVEDGSEAAPSLAFTDDETVGMYRVGGSIRFSTAGTHRFTIGTSSIIAKEPIEAPNGTLSNPGLSFENSPDTGFLVSLGILSAIQDGDSITQWITGSGGAFRPSSQSSDTLLGTNLHKWEEVYAANGTINTSDATLKENVVDSVLGLEFISQLRPVSYKWIDTESRTYVRPHYGFIAQEVKAVIDNLGLDFAGYIDPGEGNGTKGLRYIEFIAPLVKAVQELKDRVETLEAN